MIPAPFEYERAESVDHAIQLLGEREDAKILAGGHSLLPPSTNSMTCLNGARLSDGSFTLIPETW